MAKEEKNIDNYKFSPQLLKKSGGDFKEFLKERYGKELTVAQQKEIHDKFYGELDVKNGESK